MCYHLDIPELSKVSKLWNCYLQIYQFLPRFYYERHYSSQWRFQVVSGGPFPKQFPVMIQIFLDLGAPNITLFNTLRYQAKVWALGLDDREYRRALSTFCRTVFFYFSVNTHSLGNHHLSPETGTIVQQKLIKLCPCLQWKDILLRSIDTADLGNFGNLLEMSLPAFQKFTWIWETSTDGEPHGNIVGRVMHFLANCDNLTWQAKVSFSSFEDRVAHAYAKIWLDIMGNYTILREISIPSSLKHIACTTGSTPKRVWNGAYQEAHVWLQFSPIVKKFSIFPL